MLGQKTVLIIEDELTTRITISKFLKKSGYRTLDAEDGQSGLLLFYEQHPNVIILDLGLPDMDGMDIVKKIRRNDLSTPIIILSGTDEVQKAVIALKVGGDDFLSKPLTNLEILIHAIEQVIEQKDLKKENEKYQQNLEAQIIAHTEKLHIINEELQATEDKYKSYIQQSPDGIVVMGSSGQFVDMNPAASTLTGYTKEELLKLSSPLSKETEHRKFKQLFQKIKDLSQSSNNTSQMSFSKKDGSQSYWSLTASQMQKGFLIGYFRDITSQKEIALEVAKQYEIQQMLRDLASWLRICPRLEIASEDVLSQLTWLPDIDFGAMFLVESDRKLKLLSHYNFPFQLWKMAKLKIIKHIKSSLTSLSEPIYYPSEQLVDYMGEVAAESGIRTAGTIPLRNGDELEAIICLYSNSADAISSQSKDVINSIAAITSLAISRLIAEKSNRIKSQGVSNISKEFRPPIDGIVGFFGNHFTI